MADADVLQQLKDNRDALLHALLDDAESGPNPSYSLDGESVDRMAWRRELMAEIEQLQKLILMYEPYESRTYAL